jgi:hypothetical protein
MELRYNSEVLFSHEPAFASESSGGQAYRSRLLGVMEQKLGWEARAKGTKRTTALKPRNPAERGKKMF